MVRKIKNSNFIKDRNEDFRIRRDLASEEQIEKMSYGISKFIETYISKCKEFGIIGENDEVNEKEIEKLIRKEIKQF